MLLTHRLLLFLFISTLAAKALNLTPITATSDSPVLSTNSTTTLPQISTLGINKNTTINTDSPNTSSSTTTTTTTTTTHNVTPIDGNATISSVTRANTTTTAASSTSTLVSTPGNTTNHPTISTGANTSPVTTAAIHTSPHNSSTQPATNPTVTTSSNASTTSLPASVNSTIPSPNPGVSVTPSPFSTTGNATYLPITSTVTTAHLSTQVTITTLTTSGHTTPKNNATTPPITSLGNSTSPPLITHVSPLTTHGNSTVSPVTTPGNTMSTVPTPVNATTPPQPTQATCPNVPCPALSVCVNLTCQCLAGTLLENGVCVEKKMFSSELRVMRNFSANMSDPQSPAFKEIANEIIKAVNNAIGSQSGYIRTEVLKLRNGSIVASVNSFFENHSPVNQTLFDETMNKAIAECSAANCGILANANYTRTSACEQLPYPCDVNTTECNVNDGLASCNCKSAYVRSPYQTKSCIACPSGQKAENSSCVPCPFGYSGFNCNDSSLLALVVVACVLGGILLIAILAILIYICCTRGREKTQESYYNSPYPADDIQATWQSQGVTRIPRANLTSTSSGNSLEMTEGAGRKFPNNGFTGTYDLNTEDMKTFTGKNSSRYSYLVGHENPYYLEGGDRSTT